VKNNSELKTRYVTAVQRHSTSSKLLSIESSHAISYWWSIVT